MKYFYGICILLLLGCYLVSSHPFCNCCLGKGGCGCSSNPGIGPNGQFQAFVPYSNGNGPANGIGCNPTDVAVGSSPAPAGPFTAYGYNQPGVWYDSSPAVNGPNQGVVYGLNPGCNGPVPRVVVYGPQPGVGVYGAAARLANRKSNLRQKWCNVVCNKPLPS